MRGRRLVKNTISSLVFQVTTIICGFILPRVILKYYGSEINGLLNSITQFLGLISFLELGVGAVVQSSLYGPLVTRDDVQISKIVASADRFFKRLAQILLVYVLVIIMVYPRISDQSFDWVYTALLIVAMSISSFTQYYFGIVDRLLLTADQKGYVQYTVQTLTLVLNTVLSVLLICFGATIHVVKLSASIIFLLRPAVLRLYVNKYYRIERHIKYEEEPIKQKWNGVAQHIAAVVLDSTDSVVLTMFASLADVSIYSVYHLVVYGVKQLFMSMTNGIHSLIGELWAKQEKEELNKVFGWTEWVLHTGTIYVFGCTGMLLIPFISVYTNGVTDADYVQPVFAVLITAAHAMHCLRLPYSMMILAGGHYKQTQWSYIVAAVMNIIISVVAVEMYGLIGVAIGTLAAMLFQTAWMACYISKNLLCWPLINFVKQCLVDAGTVLIGVFLTKRLSISGIGYLEWFILAVKVAVIWGVVVLVVNLIVYSDKMTYLKVKLLSKFRSQQR